MLCLCSCADVSAIGGDAASGTKAVHLLSSPNDRIRRQSGLRHLSARWLEAVIWVGHQASYGVGSKESSGDVVPPAATFRTWV